MYIGNIPADKYQTLQKQSFTTSATDTYTLDYAVTNPQDLALFINNVRQNPNDAYTVSGTTLTLSSAITSSDTMYAVFLGRAVETVAPAIGSVTNDMLSSGSFSNITGTGTLTNFTSTGIDDNADATAITIDSSENLLVGKTSSNIVNTGLEFIKSSNYVALTTDGGNSLYINRKSSDGDAIEFRKDNTTIGSIGVSSSGISIKLGGTGSANALDDYEEGSFTPTYSTESGGESITYDGLTSGKYIKVGQMVYITGFIRTDAFSGGGSYVYLGGFPFTSASGNPFKSFIGVARSTTWGGDFPSACEVVDGDTKAFIKYRTSANGGSDNIVQSDMATGGNSNVLIFSGTYKSSS